MCTWPWSFCISIHTFCLILYTAKWIVEIRGNSGIAFRNFKQTAYYLEVTEYGLLAGVSNMYICSTLLFVLEGPCTAVKLYI